MAVLHVKTPNGVTKAYDLDKMGSIPVGFEYFSMNPNIPEGSLPLFGGIYDRATYPDLWAWVQTQIGYCKTEAEWQELSAAHNGNVPFYSSGDGTTTFRVPSLKCWVKGADGTVSEVGSYLEAGLPNITGSVQSRFDSSGYYTGFVSNTGALYTGGSAGENAARGTGSSGGGKVLQIDASRSSSVYGNSTTVQPESIIGLWLVKAYGIVHETGSINEQQYIDDRYNAMKTYADGKFESVVASGSKYIRYESGFQICWDFFALTTATTKQFAVPFIEIPVVVTSPNAFVYTRSTDVNNINFLASLSAYNTGNNGFRYIAMGYWK